VSSHVKLKKIKSLENNVSAEFNVGQIKNIIAVDEIMVVTNPY
jgi:hypothetical protein